MHAALYNITSNSVGEHLRNYELTEGDLVIADRIYSSISGIEYCLERKSQYLIRMRTNSFKPYNAQGTPLDFLEMMTGQESGEMKVYAKKERGDDKGKLIPVRICFKRKSEEALENTRKKLKKKESKKQKSISPAAYTFNEYIVLATSLDDSISANEILELYRYRWQAELYFKRLKSILDYGEMPKKSEKSIFAWLNGKLMIALLIESMMGKADFSPSGDLYKEYMERD
jgi:transposase